VWDVLACHRDLRSGGRTSDDHGSQRNQSNHGSHHAQRSQCRVDRLDVGDKVQVRVQNHATDPGAWVWHCHILNHVEREEGMFGMVTAVTVEPSA
jgi:FtsP/CotA-like multicopper oxidase with cupredoxin domain